MAAVEGYDFGVMEVALRLERSEFPFSWNETVLMVALTALAQVKRLDVHLLPGAKTRGDPPERGRGGPRRRPQDTWILVMLAMSMGPAPLQTVAYADRVSHAAR